MNELTIKLSDLSQDHLREILQSGAEDTEMVLCLFDASGELLLSYPDQNTIQTRFPIEDGDALESAQQVALSVLDGSSEIHCDNCFTEVIQYYEQVLGVLVGGVSEQLGASSVIPFVKRIIRLVMKQIEDLIEMETLAAEIIENYRTLGFIHDLSTELAGLMQIERVYYTVLDHLVKVVEADRGWIFRLDESTKELRCMLAYPEMVDEEPLAPVLVGEGFIGEVAKTGKSLLIEDASHPAWRSHAGPDFSPPLMCCPLQIGSDLIGAILLSRDSEARVFTSGDLKVLESGALQSASAMMNVTLLENLKQFQAELEDSYRQMLLSMTSLLELREKETKDHSIRVVQFALRLAKEMGINDVDQLRNLQLGATLHDIGKIGVSDRILLKPGDLTDDEYREIQNHTNYGYEVLKNIPFVGDAALIVRHHHENYDGTGYPMGLHGEDIPLGARIFKLADVLDALASRRPYKQPWPYPDIREEFVRLSGVYYDPQVVEAFLKVPPKEWETIRQQPNTSDVSQTNQTPLTRPQSDSESGWSRYQQMLLAIISLLELRGEETKDHSIRVVQFALRIAREMGIIAIEQLRTLQLGVLLHDIGKIGIADTILLKPGSLTNEEHREMQKHTTYGYKALNHLPFVAEAALVVHHHHENYDGSGYPMGLKGEDIPLGARIFKVADVFDALASHRPHKQPWTYQDICREFTRFSGAHYDPQVVEAFLKILPEEWEAIRARSGHFFDKNVLLEQSISPYSINP